MSWIEQGKFQLITALGRQYVYRRRNNGSKNTINVPKTVKFNKPSVKNWLKKHYKTPNTRIPIFSIGSPKKTSTPVKFNCNIGKHLYHKVANNGTVGFHRLNSKNSLNLYPLKTTTIRKGIAKLDAGKQGVVFLASSDKSVPEGSEFVIKVCPMDTSHKKQIADVEYNIQKNLYNIVPLNIPRPLAPVIKCTDFVSPAQFTGDSAPSSVNRRKNYSRQTLMFSEYIPYGPLPYYLNKLKVVNDNLIRSFIYQVLFALYKIRKVFPGFRHNDLHLDNILVRAGTPTPVAVINDFGFSTLGDSKNPLVNSGNFAKNWGIGDDTGPEYDVHLFLNEMRKWCLKNKSRSKDGFKNTILFLSDKIPEGYRDDQNKYISHMRLKYNINYPGFPSLNRILKSKYFEKNAKSLSPTPTPPPKKLKLNLDKVAFNNANLKQAGMTPNTRAWMLGKRSPKRNIINLTGNTPSPKRKTPSVNIINLTGNTPSPKRKTPTPSPKRKTPTPSPKRKTPTPSPASSSVYTVPMNKNKTPPFPKMNLATRRRLNRIAGRYEKLHRQKNPNMDAQDLRNYSWERAKKLVMKRLKAGRAPFTPSPPRVVVPKAIAPVKSMKPSMRKFLFGKKK